MGSAPLVPLSADVESPTEPGKLSVLSEEINVADYDAFYDEVVDYCKYLVGPLAERVLKEVVVEDKGPDEFTVKVVLDGSKMTSYGLGNKDTPDMDFVRSYTLFKCDKAGRTFTSFAYGPGIGFWANEIDKWEGKTGVIAKCIFLKDPLRMEYYWETTENPPEGMEPNTRYSNDMVKNVVSPILEGVAIKFANLKVRATPDAPSVFTKGEQSVISQTLNEDEVSFDTLFDSMVAVLKEDNTGNATMVEVSDTLFKKTIPPTDIAPEIVRSFICDKEKGTIVIENAVEAIVVTAEHHALNKSPLQFEAWEMDQKGNRKAGKALARLCQPVWNSMYAKATSSGSWFSW